MKKFRIVSIFHDDQKRLHREDGPALTMPNGTKKWYRHGVLHRIDGPALEFANGSKHWYQNGLRHREDGPAVKLANGDLQWWLNGDLHREDGPAFIVQETDQYCSIQQWFKNGYCHRIDGPALIEMDDDFIYKSWYVRGDAIDPPTSIAEEEKLIEHLKREDYADKFL